MAHPNRYLQHSAEHESWLSDYSNGVHNGKKHDSRSRVWHKNQCNRHIRRDGKKVIQDQMKDAA
jgi:hypothetical protein